ncbi:MAG: hypothetical protein CMJ75_21635 [Planctomycetaceae bacterium]|nr:hypothetical protein [Planctomycetaceae bacterium]
MRQLELAERPPSIRELSGFVMIRRCWKLWVGLVCWVTLAGCQAHAPADPAANLEELGATIDRDELGRIVALRFRVKAMVDDDALRHVAALQYLTTLDLDRTPITDAGLEHLKRLTRLRELALRGTRVTGHGLTHLAALSGLEELQLASCGQVTDRALPPLKKLKSLRKLAVGGTRLTPAGLQSLRASMPDCEIY